MHLHEFITSYMDESMIIRLIYAVQNFGQLWIVWMLFLMDLDIRPPRLANGSRLGLRRLNKKLNEARVARFLSLIRINRLRLFISDLLLLVLCFPALVLIVVKYLVSLDSLL